MEEQFGIGTWNWNVSLRLLYADEPAARILGVDPERARGGVTLSAFAECIHPDDRAEVIERMQSNASHGGSVVAEFRLRSADGEDRWVLARGHYDLDHAGRPLRGRGVLIDMTGSRLSDHAFGQRLGPSPAHPLERAADHCLSARDAIAETEFPFLLKLVDMLLLELGRQLAKLTLMERRRRMS
jgi:hypothetical protein